MKRKTLEVMFSSKSSEWGTPREFFEALDREFHFTLDPCATPENAKCSKFYTREEDGLRQDWGGETVFMNPPYGSEIGKWIRKAWEEAQKPGTVVVCLLPARTDTRWFHRYCLGHEIRFVKGRLRFEGARYPAPFPSMVVVFGREPGEKAAFGSFSQDDMPVPSGVGRGQRRLEEVL